MANPLLAIPLLGRAVAFGRGLTGGAKALKAVKAAKIANRVGAARAGANIPKGIGTMLSNYTGGPITGGTLARDFGMDAGFGILYGIQTPGDLGDKLIAGSTSTLGGALGGIAGVSGYSKLRGKLPSELNQGVRTLVDVGAGAAGDFAASYGADGLMRLKGGGTTPYEKLQIEQQRRQEEYIEQRLKAQYGIGGAYQRPDPFLISNGLGT